MYLTFIFSHVIYGSFIGACFVLFCFLPISLCLSFFALFYNFMVWSYIVGCDWRGCLEYLLFPSKLNTSCLLNDTHHNSLREVNLLSETTTLTAPAQINCYHMTIIKMKPIKMNKGREQEREWKIIQTHTQCCKILLFFIFLSR